MFRIRVALLTTAAAALFAVSAAQAAPPKLVGTVGPAFTITLTKGGKKVKTLKAGKYTFVIHDKSKVHNFHLLGPVSKVMTTVPFVGTKTFTLVLKKGHYRFVCDPHITLMHGAFAVI